MEQLSAKQTNNANMHQWGILTLKKPLPTKRRTGHSPGKEMIAEKNNNRLYVKSKINE